MAEDSTPAAMSARLLEEARAGGPKAALAARRAAILAEQRDPGLAREALSLAAQLEPLDPAPRLALARLHAERGDLAAARAEARAVFDEAVDQAARARAAFILGGITRVERDDAGARKAYETVMRIEDSILAGNRSDPTASRWYARARGRIAELDANAREWDRARTGAEGALAMLRAVAAQTGEQPVLAADIADAEMRLGALELDSGDANSARRRLGEAIGRYEALAVTEKNEPHWRAVLSDAWALAAEADYVRNDAPAARKAMDKALQARLRLAAAHSEEAWGLAGTWRVRAALRAALGDNDVAAESLTQARALSETLCVMANGAEAPVRFLVHTLIDQADLALRGGDLNRAREAADTAREKAEFFAGDKTASAAWLSEAAVCWDRLGEVSRAAGAAGHMQDAFARAVEFRRLALDREPGEPRLKNGLAAALIRHGEAAMEANALASARASFGESVNIRLAASEAEPASPRAAHALAAALERVGLVASAMRDRDVARAAWEDELALAERIFGEDDSIEDARFRAIVGAHLVQLGGPAAEQHRAAALAHFDDLAQSGVLTEREAALRRKLWSA